MISILCEAAKKDTFTRLLYTETTTIGVRISQIERECLDREVISVLSKYGSIDVKVARLDGNMVNAMPEYDQVRLAALKNGVPFREVRDAVLEGLNDVLI